MKIILTAKYPSCMCRFALGLNAPRNVNTVQTPVPASPGDEKRQVDRSGSPLLHRRPLKYFLKVPPSQRRSSQTTLRRKYHEARVQTEWQRQVHHPREHEQWKRGAFGQVVYEEALATTPHRRRSRFTSPSTIATRLKRTTCSASISRSFKFMGDQNHDNLAQNTNMWY